MNSPQECLQPQSENLNSREDLIRRLRKSHAARTRFVESHIDKKLAFQVRSLRGDASQEDVEKEKGIKQQVLSRLENPAYGKPTLTTLKKIAAAFDVGLLVEFVPFSQLINRVSGTPYTEQGFSPATMNLPSFEQEFRAEPNLADGAEAEYERQAEKKSNRKPPQHDFSDGDQRLGAAYGD
jgi:transcriptional regulator with XRE-family HTH domain